MSIEKIYNVFLVFIVSIVFFFLFYIFLVSTQLFTSILALIGIIFLIFIFDKTGLLEKLIASFLKEKNFSVITVIILVCILPFFDRGAYSLHLCILIFLYSAVVIGLNFQMGMIGMVNFATAAFFGVGAYTTALVTTNLHIPIFIGILLGGIIASFFGLFLGIPTLRTRDYYLSLVTIAFQFIFITLVVNLGFTGGPDGVRGIPIMSIFGYSFSSPINIYGIKFPYQINFYYLSFGLLLLILLISNRIYNSRIGLSWNAIRENQLAAACQGINLVYAKLLAFSLGALFAGLVGAVYTHYITFISPNNFSFNVSLMFICMLIFGGMDSILGIIIGTSILVILPEKLRGLSEYSALIYGAIILIMLIFRPQGLIPKRLRNYSQFLKTLKKKA